MDARCYRGEGRTRMHDAGLRGADLGVLVAVVAVLAAICVLL